MLSCNQTGVFYLLNENYLFQESRLIFKLLFRELNHNFINRYSLKQNRFLLSSIILIVSFIDGPGAIF